MKQYKYSNIKNTIRQKANIRIVAKVLFEFRLAKMHSNYSNIRIFVSGLEIIESSLKDQASFMVFQLSFSLWNGDLNVVMDCRNYLGKISCQSLNWQHIHRFKITFLGANWQLFRLERIAKYSYFISSIQNIKFH